VHDKTDRRLLFKTLYRAIVLDGGLLSVSDDDVGKGIAAGVLAVPWSGTSAIIKHGLSSEPAHEEAIRNEGDQ
jgi:hypothetical protein